MKYGECADKIEDIVSSVFDEMIEDGGIIFEEEMDRAVTQVKLKSDIAFFIFKYFGLESDDSYLNR